MRNVLAAIIVLLTLAPAEAGDEVKIGATGVLHLPNSSGGDVVIFKSQDAMGPPSNYTRPAPTRRRWTR